jgi:hypothetical protein
MMHWKGFGLRLWWAKIVELTLAETEENYEKSQNIQVPSCFELITASMKHYCDYC